MDEQKKKELQRDLEKAVEKRKQLNDAVAKLEAQKIIERLVKIICELNSDETYQREQIPYIMLECSAEKILIKSNRDLPKITDSLDCYTEQTWEEVKRFLDGTFGIQQPEKSYMISFSSKG